MKALLTAFALLSFVAASTLPMAASAEDAQTDHSMNKTDDHTMTKTDDMSGKSMHSTAKHTTKMHKKTVHKKAKHRKHTAKAKHHKTMDKTPPKEG
ncbi:MAG TPA: hypothetical protein VH020_12115 [Stellaceae bacterium]|jgi:Ni/Co efflux regulator RcnB|nr:hypothetical protein [Stellaceae bacterium]